MLNPPSQPSLYTRLGGYDVIAAIIDEMLALHRADARFARFGIGVTTDSQRQNRQPTVDQVCALFGGPCLYLGRDMKTSNAGLGITESEWNRLWFPVPAKSNRGLVHSTFNLTGRGPTDRKLKD